MGKFDTSAGFTASVFCLLGVVSMSLSGCGGGGGSGQAFAQVPGQNNILKGTYHFNLLDTCTEATGGFTPAPALEASGTIARYDSHFLGTMTFDGNGNATMSGTGQSTYEQPFPSNRAFSTVLFSCNSITYSVNADRTFNMQGAAGCTSTISSGPGAGETGNVGAFAFEGFVGTGGQTAIATKSPLNQQTVTLSGGYTAPRYCAATMTLLK